MSKQSFVPLIYGYLVCVICVIVFFIAGNGVIDAAFTYARPQSGYQCSQYSSFNEFKRTQPDISTAPSESEFQERRNQCLEDVRFQQLRSLVTSGFLLALATVLFVLHWRWVNKLRAE
jgi:hypothetical protein